MQQSYGDMHCFGQLLGSWLNSWQKKKTFSLNNIEISASKLRSSELKFSFVLRAKERHSKHGGNTGNSHLGLVSYLFCTKPVAATPQNCLQQWIQLTVEQINWPGGAAHCKRRNLMDKGTLMNVQPEIWIYLSFKGLSEGGHKSETGQKLPRSWKGTGLSLKPRRCHLHSPLSAQLQVAAARPLQILLLSAPVSEILWFHLPRERINIHCIFMRTLSILIFSSNTEIRPAGFSDEKRLKDIRIQHDVLQEYLQFFMCLRSKGSASLMQKN